MKKTSLFSRVLFILNIVFALITLLGFLSPYINPSYFAWVAFLGLGLPYLLTIHLLFVCFWLFKVNIRFVFSLLVLGLGYKNIQSHVQLRFSKQVVEENDFKVMSFNVRVFDLYLWSKDKNARRQIFNFLEKENPDVLCLQEFYHSDREPPNYEFNTLDTLVNILSAKNYHVHFTTSLRETDHWGIVTFSKYPITNKGIVPLEGADDNTCIYSDLQINGQTIRIYNAHLASIKLAKRDYKTIRNKEQKNYTNLFEKGAELITKLKSGFEKRSDQANSIHTSIEESPFPLIVCGDFNDTPSSYAYQTIKGNLKDGFVESGAGLGRTYIGEFPSFRIDYLLFSDYLKVKSFTTHPEELSDHHPISAYFSLQKR